MKENDLSQIVIGLCIKIHRTLGPGLLESIYEEVLCYELKKAGLSFKRQHGINVIYDGMKMDIGFRADLIIADKLIVELKSVETIAPVHSKILLTYLRLTNIKLGLLINFNVVLMINGIKRVANNL
ncbi:MAG: GxxExxY protein [Marivirga sp.]|nr:GxxExxY protein [Marivirga sp.]